jgi:hypothetical protein
MHLSTFPGGRERNLTSFSLHSGTKRHSCTSLQGNSKRSGGISTSFKVRGLTLGGLLSAGFVPLAVAAFVTSGVNYPVLDGMLGVSLVMHSHIRVRVTFIIMSMS